MLLNKKINQYTGGCLTLTSFSSMWPKSSLGGFYH